MIHSIPPESSADVVQQRWGRDASGCNARGWYVDIDWNISWWNCELLGWLRGWHMLGLSLALGQTSSELLGWLRGWHMLGLSLALGQTSTLLNLSQWLLCLHVLGEQCHLLREGKQGLLPHSRC